jgi:hypothetical protein
MVLCADSVGLKLGSLLEIEPELERLRDLCKVASSASQVTGECEAAQNRLKAKVADVGQHKSETTLSVEARRGFFKHGDFGPAGLGLLRVLHEIGGGSGDIATAHGLPAPAGKMVSRHLRLPLASETLINSLHLWAVFLRCAIPKSLPLLFIARNGVNWLDVVIGGPANDDLFCLQASPNALPLATEIPYELSPALKPRLQELGIKFLGLESPTTTAVSPVSAALPTSGTAAEAENVATRPGNKKGIVWFGFILLTLVGGAGFYIYYSGEFEESLAAVGIRFNNVASEKTQGAPRHDFNSAPAKELEEKKMQQWYETSLTGIQAALSRSNYTDAITRADKVLEISSNDATAMRLRTEAKYELDLLAAKEIDVKHLLSYESATNAAEMAFEKGNYADATKQAGIALNLRPNDPVALLLMTRAKQRLASASSQSPIARSTLTATNPPATNPENVPNAFTNTLGGNMQRIQ